MNQIIDELVELNTAIKAPKTKVAGLISNVGTSVQESEEAFNVFYKVVDGNCKSGNKIIGDFRANLKGDKVQATAARSKMAKSIRRNSRSLMKLTANAKKAKASLAADHKRQAAEAAIFRKALNEAEQKIVVIRHVRNIVVDELLNGKAPASLLQVNTITSKLSQLKSMVEQSHDSLFSMVVGNLLEMATSQNLNDQKILRKFLAALAKLNKKITAWRKKSIKENKTLARVNQKSNRAELNSIRALGKLVIEAKSAITGAKKAMGEIKHNLRIIRKSLTRKSKEMRHWKGICSDQQKVMRRFRREYKDIRSKVAQVSSAMMS